MEQKFYENFWFPSSPKDNRKKVHYRHDCCDLMGMSRQRVLGHSPYRTPVHDCVKLLEELLTDCGSARAAPLSCRCQASSLQDSCSLALVFSPMFQMLARCHEEEQRHRAALESPFQLLRGLFLQLDMMRCWNKLVTVLPRLQDLLEVCSSVLVPRPQSMCLSCRGCQAVESEVSPDKRQKCSSRRAVRRRLEERRHSIDLHADCVCDLEQTGDLSEKEERFDQRQKPGLLGSIQQLKNSLKKDLETHQLYLRAMGTRLSGLERRARDVTRHLERANLELEAIKQGSVTLKTLVDQQISSCPDAEDLEDYEDILREAWQQSRRAGRSEHPESYRTNETVRSSASEYPAGGVGVHQREELQTCQRHVSVLIQQITRQINQMESDIKFTSKQRQSTR